MEVYEDWYILPSTVLLRSWFLRNGHPTVWESESVGCQMWEQPKPCLRGGQVEGGDLKLAHGGHTSNLQSDQWRCHSPTSFPPPGLARVTFVLT